MLNETHSNILTLFHIASNHRTYSREPTQTFDIVQLVFRSEDLAFLSQRKAIIIPPFTDHHLHICLVVIKVSCIEVLKFRIQIYDPMEIVPPFDSIAQYQTFSALRWILNSVLFVFILTDCLCDCVTLKSVVAYARHLLFSFVIFITSRFRLSQQGLAMRRH